MAACSFECPRCRMLENDCEAWREDYEGLQARLAAAEAAQREAEGRVLVFRQLLGEAWPFVGRDGFHPDLKKRINAALAATDATSAQEPRRE